MASRILFIKTHHSYKSSNPNSFLNYIREVLCILVSKIRGSAWVLHWVVWCCGPVHLPPVQQPPHIRWHELCACRRSCPEEHFPFCQSTSDRFILIVGAHQRITSYIFTAATWLQLRQLIQTLHPIPPSYLRSLLVFFQNFIWNIQFTPVMC